MTINTSYPAAKTTWGIGSFQALAMFRRGLFYAYLSIYLRYYLGMSVTETTLFSTLPMLVNFLSQTFFWGRFSDSRQLRRTLILWGEAIGAIGTVAVWGFHALTNNLYLSGWVIIIGLSLVEIFWSMSNIAWSALISDIYPGHKRNEIMGYLTSIGGIGRFIGIWIGGVLYDGFGKMYQGWGFHSGFLFFIAAGVMLISMIPVKYLPEGGIRKEDFFVADCSTSCQAETIRLFWIFLVAMFFINFGRNAVLIVQSQYLVLEAGFNVSSRMLSYIYNMDSAAVIIFGIFAGRIGRWIGNGRSICLAAVSGAIYLVLFAFTGQLFLIFVGSFFHGISEVIVTAASYAFASMLIPPERRAHLFSLFNATLFLSWGLGGTFVAGPIVDSMMHAGFAAGMAYRAAFLVGLALVVIGLAIQSTLVFILLPKSGIPREMLREQ